MGGFRCCACCEGIAKDDHVGFGGHVEKDGHDGPCETCEFEERIRPRLAVAWAEGLDAGRDRWADSREFGEAPVNPYDRDTPTDDAQGGRADG